MKAPLITAVFAARSVASLQAGEDHTVSSCFQDFSEVESKHNIFGQLQMSLKHAWFLILLEKENVALACVSYR